jgi:hypothetical protein
VKPNALECVLNMDGISMHVRVAALQSGIRVALSPVGKTPAGLAEAVASAVRRANPGVEVICRGRRYA